MGGRTSLGGTAPLPARAAARAALLALVLVAVMAPARAGALDSDLKHSYAFTVKATNGYRLVAVADSQRADGKGEVVLFDGRGNAGVTYLASATVTATRIEADLGRLGEVSLDVAPSGKKMTLRTCGTPKTVSFEPPSYSGSFEFHGEEGYAEAVSGSPRDYTQFFAAIVCGNSIGGESWGAGEPGAKLRLRSRRGSSRLTLQANKNRPGARTRFEVETHEARQGISISRHRTLWAGAGAFEYDPLLRTASLTPPAPFSGQGSFHRDAVSTNRWSGDLTVDLPGRSDVPLTGAGVDAILLHACRQEGEGEIRCRPHNRPSSVPGSS